MKLVLICGFLWFMPYNAAAQVPPTSTTAFITVWEIPADGFEITLPLPTNNASDLYKYMVNWGDGTATTGPHRGPISYTYTSSGLYTVTMSGTFSRFNFVVLMSQHTQRIVSIDQWGNNRWTDMAQAFQGCRNLEYAATDEPDLSEVTRISSMFRGATVFNGNIGRWDVSNVDEMFAVFRDASAFNQDIGRWEVSNVTNMIAMFRGASMFNQDISEWNVGNVTRMDSMFRGASMFNKDISSWDVSKVTSMNNMFQDASMFDQDIGDWDVSKVTNMRNMFSGVTLSTDNYDALLVGWSTIDVDEGEVGLQNGVNFHAGGSKYCNQRAKDILINTYDWMVTDGRRDTDTVCGTLVLMDGTGTPDQHAVFGTEFRYTLESTFQSSFDSTLTYTVSGLPSSGWLSFNTEPRTFSGTPTTTEDIGVTTITVTAIDFNGNSADDTFTLTVPNRPPAAMGELTSQTATVGNLFEYQIPDTVFSDPDGGLLSYMAPGRPSWLDFSTINNTFSGTPTETTHIGISTITVTVTDPNGGSLTDTFTLTVPNRPPEKRAGLSTITTTVGQTLSYRIPADAFIDPDGGSLSYSISGEPGWLRFSTETDTFFGNPTRIHIGTSTITLTVSDVNGGSLTDSFRLIVEGVTDIIFRIKVFLEGAQ